MTATVTKEAAENTDKFTQSTKRCTRRSWDAFLSVRDNIEAFNTRLVRGRLELASASAANDVAAVLKDEAGVDRMTMIDTVIECTATLADVQRVIKRPDFVMFDCVLVD